MTFREWLEESGAVGKDLDGRSDVIQVFSTDKELWHLEDYAVSSAVSGSSVILVRRG